ncbi:hypothetical protein AtDm6_3143 [Acetobacter tropicalis]|uniref:Uncharacterized protein n=1 Tax=Acetobacter tropicalis TaxID=104102 RepID=A0A095AWK6_9PROT|nr:hypothetical protein AtDm6_3143 [Acetobacter tropicalis]
MIAMKLVEFVLSKWTTVKKRRANAELEASMARRLEKSRQPRDHKGRYMRTCGAATCSEK